MLKRLSIFCAAVLCFAALVFSAASGSVPKVIVIEEYGATW